MFCTAVSRSTRPGEGCFEACVGQALHLGSHLADRARGGDLRRYRAGGASAPRRRSTASRSRRARRRTSRRRSSARPPKPRPISAPLPPRHPFMAANGRSNIHDDAYMTDTYAGSGPLGRDMRAALDLPGRRVRVGHVRPRRPDRGGLRRARGPAARDARPPHARPAGGVPAAAAPARRGEPVHRLLRRRLLLPRQPRPRGGPDHHPPHLGRSARRTARSGPGSRSSATTT